MKSAVYPGTFDPVTFGHIDVVKRALQVFDRIVVGVTTNPAKKPFFSIEERVSLLKESLAGMEGVDVKPFSCLLVEFARQEKAVAVLRGLREMTDFAEEFQRATVNRKLAPDIETVFILPSADYFYLSSSMARELASFGAKLDNLVPKTVEKALAEKLGGKP